MHSTDMREEEKRASFVISNKSMQVIERERERCCMCNVSK
jgi:hypothetical protein